MAMNQKVLVYGTLKKGNHNSDFLKDSTYIGEVWTKKEYSLLEDKYCGLPYATKEESYPLKCELYEVDEWTFMMLDNLEGHPHFYKREKVECILETKKDVIDEEGWLYFYNNVDKTATIKLPVGEW